MGIFLGFEDCVTRIGLKLIIRGWRYGASEPSWLNTPLRINAPTYALPSLGVNVATVKVKISLRSCSCWHTVETLNSRHKWKPTICLCSKGFLTQSLQLHFQCRYVTVWSGCWATFSEPSQLYASGEVPPEPNTTSSSANLNQAVISSAAVDNLVEKVDNCLLNWG